MRTHRAGNLLLQQTVNRLRVIFAFYVAVRFKEPAYKQERYCLTLIVNHRRGTLPLGGSCNNPLAAVWHGLANFLLIRLRGRIEWFE